MPGLTGPVPKIFCTPIRTRRARARARTHEAVTSRERNRGDHNGGDHEKVLIMRPEDGVWKIVHRLINWLAWPDGLVLACHRPRR